MGSTCDVLTLGGATEECAEVGAEVALLAALTWGAGGGLLGAGVGALIRREFWTDIPFARTDLSFRPIIGRWSCQQHDAPRSAHCSLTEHHTGTFHKEELLMEATLTPALGVVALAGCANLFNEDR